MSYLNQYLIILKIIEAALRVSIDKMKKAERVSIITGRNYYSKLNKFLIA